jgi:hypothetical protein
MHGESFGRLEFVEVHNNLEQVFEIVYKDALELELK